MKSERLTVINLFLTIDGNGTIPLRISTGLIYGNAAVSENNASPYLLMQPNFTATFWVYVFRKDQTSYLMSKVGLPAYNFFSITHPKVELTWASELKMDMWQSDLTTKALK